MVAPAVSARIAASRSPSYPLHPVQLYRPASPRPRPRASGSDLAARRWWAQGAYSRRCMPQPALRTRRQRSASSRPMRIRCCTGEDSDVFVA